MSEEEEMLIEEQEEKEAYIDYMDAKYHEMKEDGYENS